MLRNINKTLKGITVAKEHKQNSKGKSPLLWYIYKYSQVAKAHVQKANSHVLRATAHVQRATAHVQRATSHVQRATAHVQRATAHVPHNLRI